MREVRGQLSSPTDKNVRIRRASAADAPSLRPLIEDLRAGSSAESAPIEAQIARFLRPPWALFVAEREGEVIGCALVAYRQRLGYALPEAWLSDMVVADAGRRAGVGRALLEAVEDQARRWECGTVRLESRATRTDAHAFYEAGGYAQHGVSFEKVLPSRRSSKPGARPKSIS